MGPRQPVARGSVWHRVPRPCRRRAPKPSPEPPKPSPEPGASLETATSIARRAWRSPVAARARPALESVNTAIRGYRYATSLPASGRFPSGAADSERSPNRLETYFDAHREGPGIWKWRHYLPVYERHFSKSRSSSGVRSTSSRSASSAEAALPCGEPTSERRAEIYGVDVERACHT